VIAARVASIPGAPRPRYAPLDVVQSSQALHPRLTAGSAFPSGGGTIELHCLCVRKERLISALAFGIPFLFTIFVALKHISITLVNII
jgi:hypothetical protein